MQAGHYAVALLYIDGERPESATSSSRKPSISSASETLTASEQQQLLRRAKETDEYARKAFSQNAPRMGRLTP